MATIGERLLGRDQELFVGRDAELALFEALLDGEMPQRVVHNVGPGGVGKSALLREVSRRARERGFDTVWVDGRDMSPFPAEINAALAELADASPAFVVFDSYELINSLEPGQQQRHATRLDRGEPIERAHPFSVSARRRPGRVVAFHSSTASANSATPRRA